MNRCGILNKKNKYNMFDFNKADKTGDRSSNDLSHIVTNRCSNFEHVLINCDDQVTVRELLKELVPINIQIEITERFNQEYAKRQIARNGW